MDRIERARGALDYYSENSGSGYSEPDETIVTDLLADLMHLAAEDGEFDFDDALDSARMHFSAEVNE